MAIKHRITLGGWVPRGHQAEDGPIASKYELREMRSWSYLKRTLKTLGLGVFCHDLRAEDDFVRFFLWFAIVP